MQLDTLHATTSGRPRMKTVKKLSTFQQQCLDIISHLHQLFDEQYRKDQYRIDFEYKCRMSCYLFRVKEQILAYRKSADNRRHQIGELLGHLFQLKHQWMLIMEACEPVAAPFLDHVEQLRKTIVQQVKTETL